MFENNSTSTLEYRKYIITQPVSPARFTDDMLVIIVGMIPLWAQFQGDVIHQ